MCSFASRGTKRRESGGDETTNPGSGRDCPSPQGFDYASILLTRPWGEGAPTAVSEAFAWHMFFDLNVRNFQKKNRHNF